MPDKIFLVDQPVCSVAIGQVELIGAARLADEFGEDFIVARVTVIFREGIDEDRIVLQAAVVVVGTQEIHTDFHPVKVGSVFRAENEGNIGNFLIRVSSARLANIVRSAPAFNFGHIEIIMPVLVDIFFLRSRFGITDRIGLPVGSCPLYIQIVKNFFIVARILQFRFHKGRKKGISAVDIHERNFQFGSARSGGNEQIAARRTPRAVFHFPCRLRGGIGCVEVVAEPVRNGAAVFEAGERPALIEIRIGIVAVGSVLFVHGRPDVTVTVDRRSAQIGKNF